MQHFLGPNFGGRGRGEEKTKEVLVSQKWKDRNISNLRRQRTVIGALETVLGFRHLASFHK